MKKSERNMVVATALIVGGALLFQFVIAPALEGDSALASAGEIDNARARFKRYSQTVKDGDIIREDYATVAFSGDQQIGKDDPGRTFSNQLYSLLTSQLKVTAPDISQARYELIENVDDFILVESEIDVNGSYAEMMGLLTALESHGLLIKRYTISRSGRRGVGSVAMNLRVARLIKPDPDDKRTMDWIKRAQRARR